MHAKGWGAHGTFTVTNDISRYTKAKIFSQVGKQTPLLARISTVAGEHGTADAERDIRGSAAKFYTEEGNWDIVGNNTPVFFFRDPLRFSNLNHAIKRDPRTGLRCELRNHASGTERNLRMDAFKKKLIRLEAVDRPDKIIARDNRLCRAPS